MRLDRPLQLALAHELVVQLRLHLDLLHQRAVHLVRRARAVESRQRRRVAAVVREPVPTTGRGLAAARDERRDVRERGAERFGGALTPPANGIAPPPTAWSPPLGMSGETSASGAPNAAGVAPTPPAACIAAAADAAAAAASAASRSSFFFCSIALFLDSLRSAADGRRRATFLFAPSSPVSSRARFSPPVNSSDDPPCIRYFCR